MMSAFASGELAVYAASLLAALASGFAAIAFLMRFLKFNSLYAFVAYRVALA